MCARFCQVSVVKVLQAMGSAVAKLTGSKEWPWGGWAGTTTVNIKVHTERSKTTATTEKK